MPEINLFDLGEPIALEFYSFFTGSRVIDDQIPFGKPDYDGIPYDQSNYPYASEFGGDNIEDPFIIAEIPTIINGTTNGYADDYDEVCPYDSPGAPDVVYSFTPSEDFVVDLSLCSNGNEYDTKIYVYENNVGNLAPTLIGDTACNDDYCNNDFTQYASFIQGVILTQGNTYYIIIDGYAFYPQKYGINPKENLLYLSIYPYNNSEIISTINDRNYTIIEADNYANKISCEDFF